MTTTKTRTQARQQRWVTSAVIAESLAVDEQTVRRWLREGLLPDAARLPGGAWRVPADAAVQILKAGTEHYQRRVTTDSAATESAA